MNENNKKFYRFRQLTLKDIPNLHKMYEALSNKSKRFYYSKIYGKPKGLTWFLAQIAFMISLTPLKKIILNIYPEHIYFIIGAFNSQNELIGFAHFVIHNRLSNGKFIARLGIAVKDDYQNKGVGSQLMKELLNLAKNQNVGKIYLKVHPKNTKAIRLYQNYGFRIANQNINSLEMELYL